MVEFPRQKNFKAQLTSTQVRYTGENQQIPKKKPPKNPNDSVMVSFVTFKDYLLLISW